MVRTQAGQWCATFPEGIWPERDPARDLQCMLRGAWPETCSACCCAAAPCTPVHDAPATWQSLLACHQHQPLLEPSHEDSPLSCPALHNHRTAVVCSVDVAHVACTCTPLLLQLCMHVRHEAVSSYGVEPAACHSPLLIEVPDLRSELGGELGGVEAVDQAHAALASQQAAAGQRRTCSDGWVASRGVIMQRAQIGQTRAY
jgi:hypothetical protein